MKKLSGLVLSIAMILSVCLCFTGCNNGNKVELTSENYSEYLAINVYYTDCQVAEKDTSGYLTSYRLICTANIETHAKKECTFENAKIAVTFSLNDWKGNSNLLPSLSNQYSIELSANGYSHSTVTLTRSNANIAFPSSADGNVGVVISGYVIL